MMNGCNKHCANNNINTIISVFYITSRLHTAYTNVPLTDKNLHKFCIKTNKKIYFLLITTSGLMGCLLSVSHFSGLPIN